MTYALLLYAPDPRPEPEEVIRAVLQKHKALQAEASTKGELLSVAQLTTRANTKVVKKREGTALVTDGPYIETKEWLVGFYLLECDEKTALAFAAKLCVGEQDHVEVQQVSWHKIKT